jgi:autotransporter-associated beta strand protein
VFVVGPGVSPLVPRATVVERRPSLGGVVGGLIGALLLIWLAPQRLSAATVTWTGGGADNNWTTAANWGGTAPVAGDSLVFAGITRLAPNNNFAAGTSFTSITFSVGAGNFVIGGNAFTLTGGTSALTNNASSGTMTISQALTFSTAAPTITVVSGGTLTLSGTIANGGFLITTASSGTLNLNGIISGTGGLTQAASGVTRLAGVNTYTGATTVSAGILRAGVATAIPSGAGRGDVTVNGTLDLNALSVSVNGLSGSGTVTTASGTGTYTLTVGNNDATSTFAGLIQNGTGTVALTKTGTGTLTLSGLSGTAANNWTGATTLGQGALAITGTAALTGAFNFGASASTTPGMLDLSNGSVTFTGLMLAQTNSATASLLTIGSGRTLTLNGGLTMGIDSGAATVTKLTVSGAGALVVAGGSVQVGRSQTTVNAANNSVATLDLSGLTGGFATTSAVTNFNVGQGNSSHGYVTLTNTSNTIIATTMNVGHSNGNNGVTGIGPNLLTLGTGTNVIQCDTINIGFSKIDGLVTFASQTAGSPGAVTINNKAGTGAANINIGSHNGTATSATFSGVLDLRGHAATVSANGVQLGIGNNTLGGSVTGELRFDAGAMTITTLTMGSKAGTGGTGTATGQLTIGGGTCTVTTTTTAINTAATGAGVSVITITGGTYTANGNITRTGGTGTVSTLTLNGGTLVATGRNIGSATQPIIFEAQSGTLTGLTELNGGGAWTKTGAGLLTVGGANLWSGTTTITAGTLRMATANALPSGTGKGGLTVSGTLDLAGQSTAVNGLAGAGLITSTGGACTLTVGNNNASSTFDGLIQDGSGTVSLTKTGSGTLTLSGANAYTGATTIGAGVLRVTGSTAVGSAVTLSGGTLEGGGTVGGGITVTSGTISPGAGGNTIATLTTGAVTCTASSVLVIDLDSVAPACDRLSSTGTVVLNGSLSITAPNGGASGVVHTIVSGTSVSGTFTGLAEGAILTSGPRAFRLNYGATAVTLTDLSKTWDGGGVDDLWTTPENWVGDVAPVAGDSLIFAGTTRLSPTNDFPAGTSFTSMTFAIGAGDFVVGGNALTLTGGSTAITSSATSGAMTISMPVTIGTNAGTISTSSGGSLTLSGALANGGLLLTVNNAGPVTLANSVTGSGGLTKLASGRLTLSGLSTTAGNNFGGALTIDAGTMAVTTSDAVLSGAMLFGAAAGSANVVALDLSTASLTTNALTVRTNSASANTITIGGGRTLTTLGNVTIGNTVADATTLLTMSGAGAWVVNAPAGQFWLGAYVPATSPLTNRASLDLSGLANFTCNLTTGAMLLGRFGDNNTKSGTLSLAGNSTISAATMTIGESNSGSPMTVMMGSGATVLQVDTLNLGTGGRDSGSLQFAGATGTLQLRNRAGTGRANVNIQTGGATTGYNTINVFDVSGHSADLLVDNFIVGGQPRGGVVTNTISFSNGILDITTLRLGERSGTTATANGHTSTLNISGGTVLIGTGGLQMGSTSATGGTANVLAATVNISGGTVTIANNSSIGAAVRLANNTAGSGGTTANGALNLSGGTLTMQGNLILGATTRPATAAFTQSGGTLNCGGFGIGGAGALVTTTWQAGTLMNLATHNNGGTITKTTAGTLIISGTNGWSGNTVVSAGTIQLGSTNALPSGIGKGDLTLGGTLDLAGFSAAIGGLSGAGTVTSSIAGACTLTVGANNASASFAGVAQDGSGTVGLTKAGSGTQILTAANTYTGATTINAGILRVSGSTAAGSAVNVAGGRLEGSGTIAGAITVGSASTIAPGLGGSTLATLTTGSTSFAAGGNLVIDLNGSASPTADLLTTPGTVELGGTLTVNSAINCPVGGTYTIVSASGGLSGTFAGLPQGARFTGAGRGWQVTYDYTGNVVTLSDQSSIWDGGGADDHWQTAANWAGDVAPSPGASLIFAGNVRTTPVNDFPAGTTFASISFALGAGDFIIGGNALTLSGGSLINFATSGMMTCTLPLTFDTLAPTIATAAGGTTRFTGTVVTGGLSLTITDAGILQLGDGVTDGAIVTSATVVNQGVLSYVTAADQTIGYAISGTGALGKGGSATLTLAGANAYSGTTTITAGTLRAGIATQAFGIGSPVVLANAAGAMLDLAGFNTTIGSLAGAGATGGAVVLGSGNLTMGGDNTSTSFAGSISGSGAVIKTGTGTMTYAGTSANTYTGVTIIIGGTLVLQKTGVAAVVGDITIGDANGSDVLRLGASDQIADSSVISCVSGGAGNSAKFELNGYLETIAGFQSNANQATVLQNTETGGAAGPNNPAVLTIANTVDYIYDGYIRNGGGGTVGLTKAGPGLLTLRSGSGAGNITYTGVTTLSAGRLLIDNLSNFSSAIVNNSTAADALTFNQTTQTLNLGTAINGTGALTKTGTGLLNFTGGVANTYSGVTTIPAGRIHLNRTAGITAIAGDLHITGGMLSFGTNNQIADTSAVYMSGPTSVFNGTGVNAGHPANLSETIAALTVTGGCFNAGQTSQWTITGTLSFTGGGNTIFVGNNGTRLTVGTLMVSAMTATAGGTVATNDSFTLYGTNTAQVSTITIGAGGLLLDGSVINLRRGNAAGQLGSRLVLNGEITTSGITASAIREDTNGGTFGTIAVELSGTAGATTRTVTTVAGGADLTIAIPVTNGAATPASLVKSGAGALTANATNTWSGGTTVAQGALYLVGTHATSAVTVDAGVTLGGNGTIAGTVTLNGMLAPGTGGTTTGGLNTGALTWTSGAGMTVDLNGSGGIDSLTTPGQTLAINGPLTVASLINESPGQVFTILGANTITGAFSNAPDEGDLVAVGAGGKAVSVSYATPGLVRLTSVQPPVITAVSPDNGPMGMQTPITITGDFFDPTAIVLIGGVPATSVVVDDSRTIRAVTPAGGQGAVDVSVVNPGTSTGTLVGGYAFTGPAPTVTSISPASGSAMTTTPITITGTNFFPGTPLAVSIGGFAATAVTYVNGTTITATVPAMGSGTDAVPDVVVTNGDRQQVTVADGFTYDVRPADDATGAIAGLAYRYHRVGGPLLPDFSTLVPFQHGTRFNPNLSANPVEGRNDNWSIEFGGYVEVPVDGIYTFFTASDDGSKLFIGTTEVVSNNFAQGVTERSGQIALSAGMHRLRVEFAQGGGGYGLAVRWQGPTLSKADIPDLAYFCDPAPVISSLSPDSGPQGGGTVVTISGSGFVPGSLVAIDGVLALSPIVVDANTITMTTPGGSNGAKDVLVMGPRSAGATRAGAFTYLTSAAPTLTAITPAAGSALGGTTVTLTVSNVDVTPVVTFNGVAATSVVRIDASTVTCVTPAMPSADATADVMVTVGGQSAALADGYTWNGLRTPENPSGAQPGLAYAYYRSGGPTLPTFSSLTPDMTGVVGSSASPTVFGWTTNPIEPARTSNFSLRYLGYLTVPADGVYRLYTASDDGSRLYIGGTLVVDNNFAQGVTERSGVIALAAGTHLMTVEFAQGGGGFGLYVRWQGPGLAKADVPNAAFTTDPTPTINGLDVVTGPQSGGTAVTITGSGFTSAAQVTFGGTAAIGITVVDSTTIQCTTPSQAAGAVDVAVINPTGTRATYSSFTYTVSAGPTITALDVTSGPAGGGTAVTVTGTGFGAPMTVTFGGQAAVGVTVVNPTTITLTTPAMQSSTLTVDVTVTNGAAQSATLVGGFTYLLRAPENPGNLQSGLTYRYHRVAGPLLPDFTGLTPYAIGVRNTPVIAVGGPGAANPFDAGYNNNWSVEYRGYITVPVDDIYTFFTESDDGSQLLVGSAVVVANNFSQGMTERSGSIGLQAGTHQLAIRFAQGGGNFGLNVRWQSPGISKALIPDNVLWTDATPTFTAATPNAGTNAGGNTVTITGSGFTSGTTVSFGGAAATGVTVAPDGLSLTAVAPAHAIGQVAVVVANGNGLTVTQNNAYLYQGPAPTITAVSPIGGPIAGGTTILIYGTNFVAGATVTIGGVAATNVSVGSGVISARTPPGTRGPADVTVTNIDATSVTRSPGFYYQGPAPTIAGISPASGPMAGGAVVTITGTNFVAGAGVTFGGAAATGVTVVSSTVIEATTPPGAQGPANIVVTNFDMRSATRANGYIFEGPAPVVSSIAPTSGPMAGGTSVTIAGSDFVAGATVTIDGVAATGVTVVSGTTITATTPAGTQGPADVTVTNIDLLADTLAGSYIYLGAPPTISGITPAAVPINYTTTDITIDGTGFVPGVQVTVQGQAATIVSVSSTAVVFRLPVSGLSPGPAPVVVTNVDLQSATLNGFIVQGPAPILTGIDVPHGPIAGGRRITLTGSEFRIGATVTLDGVPATIESLTATTIVVLTPAHAAGRVTVTVTNDDLLSSSLVDAYTYYTHDDNSTAGNGCGTGGGLAVLLFLTVLGMGGGFARRR